MENLLILAHAKKEGFNRAIARSIEVAVSDLRVVDLYAEDFNPVLPEEELNRKFSFDETTLHYQEAIQGARRVFFVYPDWWGGPPAILKGFLDRVLRPGIAYGFREADFRDADAPGLFSDKTFDIFITTDETIPPTKKAVDWAPARVWKENVLGFCGAQEVVFHVFWNLRKSTYLQRKAYLDSIGELCKGP
jgi:putative NADPH-quinone reductase